MNLNKIVLPLLCTIGTAIVSWSLVEARWPRLKRECITVPSDKPWRLTILHVSDLHIWKGKGWIARYLAELARLQPNLVVLTGDNFAEAAGLAELKEALTPLSRYPGIFCYGSNDYYSGLPKLPIKYFFPKTAPGESADQRNKRKPDLPTATLTEWLEGKGWLNLNNRAGELDLPAQNQTALKLVCTGVDDPHINRDERLSFPEHWLNADLRIGLTHAPYSRMLNSFWAAGTQLVLAGHTHGGQICLPGGKALVNNTDLALQYSGGLLRWNPTMQKVVKPRKRKGKVIAGELLSSITRRVFRSPAKGELQTVVSSATAKTQAGLVAGDTTGVVIPETVVKSCQAKSTTASSKIIKADSQTDYQQALELMNQLGKDAKLLRVSPTGSPFSWVNISRGLGTSKYTPVRLFCRPEASLITIIGKKMD